MEERKLNLNTPLLSVRRNLSSASMNATSLLKGRKVENSRPRNRPRIQGSMDQVTEPVSVPFTWEQVPGKAKDDGEPELLPSEETLPALPKIVARNSPIGVCPEKEFTKRSQSEKGSVTDEDETYSDSMDTLSPSDSFSVSYSVSSLGGSEVTVAKPSGTFSIDAQTREFMMGRFLPAARAMAIALESSLHHVSKKPHLTLSTEQPKAVEKPPLLAVESGTPTRQHNTEVVKYCTQALCQTESSDEEEEEGGKDDDCSECGPVPENGCGLLPQLCLGSSLRLLNPVPGLKSRIRNSMPFVPAIRKDSKDESIGQYVSEVGQIKPPGGSNRHSFSGELQRIGRLSPFRSRRNDAAISEKTESPRPTYVVPPLGGSRQLNLSGELRPTRKLSPFRSTRNDVATISEKNKSPRPPHVVPSLSGSTWLNFSGELRTTGGLSSYVVPSLGRVGQHNFSGELRSTSQLLSPFRLSRNDVVNLEKNESPRPSYVVPPPGLLSQHNFSGELRTAGRLSPFGHSKDDVTVLEKNESSRHSYVVPPLGWSGQRNFSGEIRIQRRQSPLPPPRNNRCIRPVSPAFERTLYVDTVNTRRDSNALDREVWTDPVASREVEDTSTGESSFQDIECLNVVTADRTSKEIDIGVVDQSSSLPLPSLKSPSDSWLCHALPSKSDRSLFSSLRKTAAPPSKKHDSDMCTSNAKWETIVKTSKTHHDHTRYSEELIEHVPRQYKS